MPSIASAEFDRRATDGDPFCQNLQPEGSRTQVNPLRVEYVQKRPNSRLIKNSFGCKVVGGAPRNAIIFRASDATAPCVTRNVELLELLAPQFEEQLRQFKDEDSFVELVRGALQDRLTGQRPSVDLISQSLHMSPRTLQRRLQESGSSFQPVLDEARHQMARYYLDGESLLLVHCFSRRGALSGLVLT
jgi:AraC-like DNA-binding protein